MKINKLLFSKSHIMNKINSQFINNLNTNILKSTISHKGFFGINSINKFCSVNQQNKTKSDGIINNEQQQSNKDVSKQADSNNNNNPNVKNDKPKKQLLNIKTKEEKAQEYQDKLYFLKYKWSKLEIEKKKLNLDFLCPDLTGHQKQQAEVIFKIVKDFNSKENLIFEQEVHRLKNRANDITKDKYNTLNELKIDPIHDPNFLQYQDILYSLTPFLSSGYYLGGASSQKSEKKVTEEIVEKVEEKPKEKAVVNVILVGFEASKKIGLIKEVKNTFGLGLKEAKEFVETPNNVLKKNVKREEAMELKEKFEKLGAKINID
jgi:ribosomal protein L7/L12